MTSVVKEENVVVENFYPPGKMSVEKHCVCKVDGDENLFKKPYSKEEQKKRDTMRTLPPGSIHDVDFVNQEPAAGSNRDKDSDSEVREDFGRFERAFKQYLNTVFNVRMRLAK
jgi:hypothetical protein